MSVELHNASPTALPMRVPCPPAALRMPPKADRSPPQTLSGISKPIPWPPSGARFPGDRISWPQLQLPDSTFTHVTSSPLRVLRMPTAPGEPFGHHVLPEGTEIQIYEGGDPPNMPDEAHDSQPTTTKNP